MVYNLLQLLLFGISYWRVAGVVSNRRVCSLGPLSIHGYRDIPYICTEIQGYIPRIYTEVEKRSETYFLDICINITFLWFHNKPYGVYVPKKLFLIFIIN